MSAPDGVMGKRDEGVLLVGYGTLLYRASLGHTIGEAPAGERAMVPVVVEGFRRLFNLRPDHYRASELWGVPGVENGAMNVEPAAGGSLNGLAFRVAAGELERLDRRERYYQRVGVELRRFDDDEPLGGGQIYSSRPDERWIERDPAALLPLWRDVVWARAGAYAIGHRFGRMFDRTTYLADGVTLVVDRYRDHLTPGEPPLAEELAAEARA